MPRSPKAAAVVAPAGGDAMMDTREVAAFLRLKERRIYALVQANALPHVRATGKLLFPRAQIEAWLATKSGNSFERATARLAPIIAGSHDPLLEWAARESQCGLAILPCGSRAGIDRLAAGQAVVAATHWLDATSGEYNVPLVRERLAGAEVVVLEWARRAQGLVLRPGNPLKIRNVSDLVRKKARVVARQADAGSDRLLDDLLQKARQKRNALRWFSRPTLTEADLAAAIHDGNADAGIAIEAAARSRGLAFIPLAVERFDLVLHRRDYFEPPVQALLDFARSREFRAHAEALGGYGIEATGKVIFNG